MVASIAANLQQVRSRIAEAALRAGRDPLEIRLVAVSKFFPLEAVLAAWEAGQREFGESRPEEAVEKIAAFRACLPGAASPSWHMIGSVQRRKAPLVVGDFALIHSLDRRPLAEKLSALALAVGLRLPVLLECNVSGEESKAGYPAAGWEHDPAVRECFFQEVEALRKLPGLEVQGLMTLAPIAEDPWRVRPVFASLRGLREILRERFPDSPWPHLSMGMTDDFEVAIAEGATLVRVGRAIFGERTF